MSGFIQDEDSLDMLECNGLNISEFDARQLEHIRKLQERNRLKRQLEKKSKSKEERRKENGNGALICKSWVRIQTE